jgi:hypothetical protein
MSNMSGNNSPLIGHHDRETRPFGGVANDVRWVGEQVGWAVNTDEPQYALFNLAAAGYFGLIDPPLSFIGDVITLPKILRGYRAELCPAPTLPPDHVGP